MNGLPAQAVELCKRGIEVNPSEETALLGYQILLRLLIRTEDQASFEHYSQGANELMRKIEKGK